MPKLHLISQFDTRRDFIIWKSFSAECAKPTLECIKMLGGNQVDARHQNIANQRAPFTENGNISHVVHCHEYVLDFDWVDFLAADVHEVCNASQNTHVFPVDLHS